VRPRRSTTSACAARRPGAGRVPPTRRDALLGALAFGGYGCSAASLASVGPAAPLKAGVITPVGCSAMTAQFRDPTYGPLLARHFSQLTPEWELKMEYTVLDDGTFRWDAPDQLAAFARANGMRLHGHTLVWYAEKPAAFERLDGQGPAFARAYRNYILAAVGRYRGVARSWDVVNEAIADDGTALREHLWSKNLGADDHMVIAFEHAAEADPDAVLFINDYFLETMPRKRQEFMRLVERLLKRGAKLGGLGTQSHLDIDMQPGMARAAIKDLASFGLPIHVSELDIAFSEKKVDLRSLPEKLDQQATVAREVAEAYAELPARQRFAFSSWGLRDKDSWIKNQPGHAKDQPLLFDDEGLPKPSFEAVAQALKA
jgi:endo-1,4-beta-xylanase